MDTVTPVAVYENETLKAVNENLCLIERADGLRFGTDAYLLSAYVRPRRRAVAVDLGSGTGIIPLLCLAREKVARVTAVELQPVFCDLISRNAVINGMQDRLTAMEADVRTLTPAMLGGEVDVVTANPPYMAPATGALNDADEKALARHELAGGIADFCAVAGRILRYGGRFFCVFRPARLTELLTALRAAQLEPKRLTAVQATVSATPSLILCEAVKGGASGLFFTPPLCLHEPDPQDPRKPRLPLSDTSDCAHVYATCSFPSHFTEK